jgi:hypothetical protein
MALKFLNRADITATVQVVRAERRPWSGPRTDEGGPSQFSLVGRHFAISCAVHPCENRYS